MDPIVKILHIPTTSKLIKETRKNIDSLTPENEALMFAVYFAAITSMDEDDVRRRYWPFSPPILTRTGKTKFRR